MSNRKPEPQEMITNSGKITESFRRYVTQISDIINGITPFSASILTFNSIEELNQAIKKPYKNQIVRVVGIGLCTYDATAQAWLKYDDTAL